MADSVYTKVHEIIDALVALALPPQHTHYHGVPDKKGKIISFSLVLAHTQAIGIMMAHWSNSMKSGADLLDDEQARQLLKWLQEQHETFEKELAQKQVLYFDILVRGLVRCFSFVSLQIIPT